MHKQDGSKRTYFVLKSYISIVYAPTIYRPTIDGDDEEKMKKNQELWRRMGKMGFQDIVQNEEILMSVGEEKDIMKTIRKRNMNLLGHGERT